MGDIWIGLYQWDENRPERGVLAGELDSKGGEDEVQVAPILKVS